MHLVLVLIALTDIQSVGGANGRNVLFALVILAQVVSWLAVEAVLAWGALRSVRRGRPPRRAAVMALMSGAVLSHTLSATAVARSDDLAPVVGAYVAAHVAVAVLAAVAAVSG